MPIGSIIESVSGFIVGFHAYQEITIDRGTVVLKSIGDEGPSTISLSTNRTRQRSHSRRSGTSLTTMIRQTSMTS